MTDPTALLTPGAIQMNPQGVAAGLLLPSGETIRFRLLEAGDARILGAYFLRLSDETKGHYGPHPFDQATADHLCASIDYADTMCWIAMQNTEGGEQAIGYFILVPGVAEAEEKRYMGWGLPLQSGSDCTLAPSLADAYQGRGIGSLLLGHLIRVTQRMGFRRMVLMGGVHATNPRAIRYYEKNGFRQVGEFEHPPGVQNYDMIMDLA
jgi:GNAT superfamily N-acetyltransferase